MSDTAPFEIEAEAIGIGRVIIGRDDNKIEVSDLISGFQVNGRVGEPTTLILKQKPGSAVISGEGIVYVHQEKIDALTVIEMMNPREIEARALDRQGWDDSGDPKSIVEHTLDLIKEDIVASRS